ncbi:MAG: class I SAM-dependent methyltransferase [Chitinophagaceae bacterium]|nr:class I SAM-dependent methyltransferase [Chitinophagaceae bacterium]
MIRYERCPVCDSTGIHHVFNAVDHTVTSESFQIWQCANCSLRFTQNVPEPNDIGRYYQSENYISHTETNKGLVNWLYLRVRKYTLSSKKRFIESETGLTKGTLLDIGAGTGAFLHHMRTGGWNIEGVEPDSGAIERAAREYQLQLKPSSELFNFSEEKFDAVTMWHVLEHVHDLHGYITQIKKIAKPGATIFIAVPNYTSHDAECYQASWAAYDVPRHLYHFSPAAMSELMKRHGLAVRKIQPMWFDSFYVSLLSEKYRTGKSNLFKGFWKGLRSNMKAFSNNRRASSIIYVIQVPA